MKTKQISLPLKLAMLCLVTMLSGCAANKEFAKAVDVMAQTNNEANKIITQLKQKDQQITDSHKTLATFYNSAQNTLLESIYLKQKVLLLEHQQAAKNELKDIYIKALKELKIIASKELISVHISVDSAEKIALSLQQESKKFPNDKELKYQATKAAADYFGRLTKLNAIEQDSLAKAEQAFAIELASAEDKLTNVILNKLNSLQEKNKEKQSCTITIPTMANSSIAYDALQSWVKTQQESFNELQEYIDSNSLLGDKGILKTIIKGIKKGGTEVLLGKSEQIPTKAQIKDAGKELVNAISEDTEEELKQLLDEIKTSFGGTDSIKTELTNLLKNKIITYKSEIKQNKLKN